MTPSPTALNQPNIGSTYAELFCDCLVSSDSGTYCRDLVLRQLRRVDLFADMLSALAHRIASIVALGAEKQVLRIATWRIVATVQNEKPFRDWTVATFPRPSMDHKEFVDASSRHVEDFSVSLHIVCADPFPAIVLILSAADEFFGTEFDGHTLGSHITHHIIDIFSGALA
jgi:hypothetical protein